MAPNSPPKNGSKEVYSMSAPSHFLSLCFAFLDTKENKRLLTRPEEQLVIPGTFFYMVLHVPQIKGIL